MDDRERLERGLTPGGQAHLKPGEIADLCVDLLGVTGAGISLMTSSGNRGAVCATNDVAAHIEQAQLTLGEGPCVDAVHAGAPVLVGDLGEPDDIAVDRWPAFMQEAGSQGVRAVFAFPLRIGAITVGAMDLYRDSPGDLTDGQLRGALLAADAAAVALLELETDADGALAAGGGGHTFDSQVHQATGMVQVQLGVTIEEAFLMLRARAFASGRPVAEIANDVVGRRLRFATEDS